MKTVCGIDLGTQSCKIIIYDYQKKTIIDTAQEGVDMIAENNGSREQKAEWYETALKTCFANILFISYPSFPATFSKRHKAYPDLQA